MMTVLEYANDVDKSVAEIIDLCGKLGIKANQEDAMLSDDDIILLDNEILMAPLVNERLESSTVIITGAYTEEEASELSKMINIGYLPVELQIESAEYLQNINK